VKALPVIQCFFEKFLESLNMLEVLIWSLFVGTLGIDGVLVSAWLRWQQKMATTQEEEEEEILSNHEVQDRLTGETISGGTVMRSPQPVNGLSGSAVPDQNATVPPKPFPQPTPLPHRKNVAATRIQAPIQAAKGQPTTSANLSYDPTTSVNIEPDTRMESPTVVTGFNHPEPRENPMYITDFHTSEWEYKIVRAYSDLFRNPTNFIQLCEEEAQAGWILLEKLDDRRVRFKRSVAMRSQIDVTQLAFDPYRCYYGPSNQWTNFMGAIAAVTAMVLPAYLGYTLVSQTLQEAPKNNSQTKAPVELINPDFAPPQIP
jgi:hypothetical protein